MEIRVLVWDDQEDHCSALVEALKAVHGKRARKHGPIDTIECVVMTGPPTFRAGSDPRKPEEDRVGARDPDYFAGTMLRATAADSQTRVVRLRVDKPQSKANSDPRQQWWPGDFHGAILDMVRQATGTKVGDAFLDWFGSAQFDGPIVVTSQEESPHARRDLRHLINVDKTRDGWAMRAAETIYRSLVTRLRDTSRPLVGCRGLDPRDRGVLKRFYAQGGARQAEWKTIWLGADDAEFQSLLEFIPGLVAVDPVVFRSLCGKPFPSFDRSPDLSALQRCFEILSDSDVRQHSSFPDLIWIDLGPGSRADFDSLTSIRQALAGLRSGVLRPFLVVILADRTRVDREAEVQLTADGIICEDRRLLLETPVLWLGNAMDILSRSWEPFVGHRKDGALAADALWKFVQAFFRSLIIARTKSHLTAARGGLSPARWFGSYPTSGDSIKTSLTKFVSDRVWSRLNAEAAPDGPHLAPRLNALFNGPNA